MIFTRFTVTARRCVEQAVQEARWLGHDSVGNEDLLLGVLAADDGIAAEALRTLGVSSEAARGEAGQLFADSLASIGISLNDVRQQAGGGFEVRWPISGRLPFSPQAKKALEQALHEALRLHDNHISGEHILLGVLRDGQGPAARLLANLGASADALEELLDKLRPRSPA